jgi:cytochrome c biogenesis protein CcdA
MGIEAGLQVILMAVTAAVINSLGPCMVGVFVLVVSAAMSAKISTQRLFSLGLIYVLTVTIVYLLAGLGLMALLKAIPIYISHYLSVILALLIIAAGLMGIKDYFWYGRGITLTVSSKLPKQIHHIAKQATVLNIVLLGIISAIVLLPCTGFIYLSFITILSQSFDLPTTGPLLLYNIVFAIPLLIFLTFATQGFDLHMIKAFKQASRSYMRLAAGLLLLAMGWLLLLITNGTINFG